MQAVKIPRMRNVLLVILDGWGHSDFGDPPNHANAVELADVPRFRRLFEEFPRTRLACSGQDVGLPDGQMGNSEVGHLNLGAGRIVYQAIARVDGAVEDGSFADRLELDSLVAGLRERGGTLHVTGLVSDGGVHSHLRHFQALMDLLPEDLPVRLHCITDGRDTSPTGGSGFVGALEDLCAQSESWAIASVIGRYWIMDRDKRWERTKRGYDLIVNGVAETWADSVEVLNSNYEAGVTDEFIEPTGIRGVGEDGVSAQDTVLLLNFRSDRMRQFASALSVSDFDGFARGGSMPAQVVTLTEYMAGLPVQVVFPPLPIEACLAEVLSEAGKKQLKVAETEKYAHVTYFFNGGEEIPYTGEDRDLVPSPKVATYDLQPEMSAAGVSAAVARGMNSDDYDFILVNFANPDMVGHTGSIPAASQAVEAVDELLGGLVDLVHDKPEWVALVTADHGNCEKMLTEDGAVHTAHTTEPVDFIVVDPRDPRRAVRAQGRLADVAPTVLALMGVPQPIQMTGSSLVSDAESV
ncbi:MAG: 2,3-bisphosphoglycerate-independent phosphoglycerate mutase [Longimicrobiales bacterium]|jgi:2,3-bisphosphoglycerate-independent phosphoglycerate mutase